MILIIAEKPSVAYEIAKVVGATKKEKGYLCGGNHLVSWCVGHLIEMAQPATYDDKLKYWSLDTLPIIPKNYITEVAVKTADQYHILKELMNRKDVTELVCATDAGREGELIFRLVYDKTGCKKPFNRLWISSIEKKSIQNGLANMKPSSEYDNLYQSALCRQRADWLLGINLTRLYSKMYDKKLICGRVQTPTTNLIVERQREIENFTPQIYYNLIANLGSFKAYAKATQKEVAQAIIYHCSGKEAIVTSVEKHEKKENPSSLYDLTTLQRDANRLLGYSSQETLDYMQKLYDSKLATYPRTDSRYITSEQESTTLNLIHMLLKTGIYTNTDYDTANINVNRIVNDKKVTDHHAILPTESLTKEKLDVLPTEERNIMLLILYRLLSAVYTPYIYTTTKVVLDINGESFTANGIEVLQIGFKMIDNYLKTVINVNNEKEKKLNSDENNILPHITEKQRFAVIKITADEKITQPPKPYTEDTLLSAMETAGKKLYDDELKEAMKNKGLGTPATRASIIESIIKTGYIKRDGKKLLPTEKAITFVDLVPDKIKEPNLTADWEKQLSDIQQGKKSPSEFMEDVTNFIHSLVSNTKKLYSTQKNTDVFKTEKEFIAICPKCGSGIVEYSKSFTCESGKNGCGFIIWKTISGKTLTKSQAIKLITKGKTDIIKGFKSKTGKLFEAHLILKEYKVFFDFPQKK